MLSPSTSSAHQHRGDKKTESARGGSKKHATCRWQRKRLFTQEGALSSWENFTRA